MRRLAIAMLFLLSFAGCGGGGNEGGASLVQQHQQALNLRDARSRAIRLIQIAYKRNAAGDLRGGQESVSAAAEAARAIDHPDEKAETLTSVAYAAGTIGWTTEANKLVREVRTAIEAAQNQEIAAAALAKLAVIYGKHLQNAAAAETYLKQAEETAAQIETPDGQAKAILAISGRYHELEKPDDAQRSSGAALEIAREIEDPRRRSETLAEAGLRLQRMGEREAAASAFDESEAAAEAITEDQVSRGFALLAVADKLQGAGLTARAAAVLKKAEEVAFKVQDPGLREPLMTKLTKQRSKLESDL